MHEDASHDDVFNVAMILGPTSSRCDGAHAPLSRAFLVIPARPLHSFVATPITQFAKGMSLSNPVRATGVPPCSYYVRSRWVHGTHVSRPTVADVFLAVGPACSYAEYTLAFTQFSEFNRGGSIRVDTGDGCPWTVSVDAPWLAAAFGPPQSRVGSGSVFVQLPQELPPLVPASGRIAIVAIRSPLGEFPVPFVLPGYAP